MAIDFKKFIKGIIVGNDVDPSKKLQIDVSNAATTNTKTILSATQTSNIQINLPSEATSLIGDSDAATLTNKTIDADTNTISNIDNNEIKANAAIDATKIADGSVSNAEFQYLSNVTSDIQGQFTTVGSNLTNHISDTTTHGTTGDIVGTSDTQTLTNKTVVVANNTITTAASGNLTSTELNAALDELQDDIDTRALNSDLTTHIADTTTHGTTGNIVGTSDTQVLTNKDIDGGTASNTSRITLPKETLTNLQSLTRKAGTVVFDTVSNKPYYDDGSNLKVIGSGSGSGVNFINDGDAEGAQIFSIYNDASGSRPTDGTGGSNAGLAIGTTNINPLDGNISFLMTKTGGTSVQGSGFSTPFTISNAYKAKVLQIEFDYIIDSGTFSAGTPSSDSSLIVYIYDITNSKLIEPSSIKLLSNSSTISDKFIANFQTSDSGTSYRLILHYATTSTSDFQIKVDNVSVGPCNYVFGTPISDWTLYTPTSGYTGGTATGSYRRVGDSIECNVKYIFTSTPGGSGTFSVPPGMTIDASKLPTGNPTLGVAWTIISGANQRVTGTAVYADATSIVLLGPSSAGGWSATIPGAAAIGDEVYVQFSAPITGFSSSVQMSNNYDGRIIAARYTTSSQSMGNGTVDTVILTTKDYDTTNSYNTSTGLWTCPKSGWYQITGTATHATRTNDTWDFANYIYVDSTLKKQNYTYSTYNPGSHFLTPTVSDTLYVTAGQTVSLRAKAGYSGSSLDGIAANNNFSIIGVNAPTTISATELIAATVSGSTTSAAGGATTVSWLNVELDTHGAFASDEFTVPASGLYDIQLAIRHNGAGHSVNQVSLGYIQTNLNGGGYVTRRQGFKFVENATVASFYHTTFYQAYLNAGDKIRAQHEATLSSPTISTSPQDVHMSIKRIK